MLQTLPVILVKLLLLSVTGAFLIFGMDIRPRENTEHLAHHTAIKIMKLACLVLLSVYVWSIVAFKDLSVAQILCIILTSLGVMLIFWAKKSLGKNFSWTGYKVANMEIVQHGPYRYVKHPLYYGVFMVEIGASINYLSVCWPITNLVPVVPTLALMYALAFNLIMARRETKNIQHIRSANA